MHPQIIQKEHDIFPSAPRTIEIPKFGQLVPWQVWPRYDTSVERKVQVPHEVTYHLLILKDVLQLLFGNGSVFIVSFLLFDPFIGLFSRQLFNRAGQVVLGSHCGVQDMGWHSYLWRIGYSVVKWHLQRRDKV